MLALKSIFAAADPVGTLVFDEVDAGIGGTVALAVGDKLAQVARRRQILCITHLATLAARGADPPAGAQAGAGWAYRDHGGGRRRAGAGHGAGANAVG